MNPHKNQQSSHETDWPTTKNSEKESKTHMHEAPSN